MSKSENRRKKNYHQGQRGKNTSEALLLDQEMKPETDTKNGAKGKKKRWVRFWDFLKRSSATDWLLTAFTLVLAVVAILQSVIIDSQLDVMRKDERAWLIVQPKEPPQTLAVGDPLTTTVTITNMGKSPAFDMTSELYIEVIANGNNPQFESQIIHTRFSAGIMTPNSPRDAPVIHEQRISAADKAALDSGQAWIATHGIVRYSDVFKKKHLLRFCSWAAEKGPLNYPSKVCPKYNSTDDQ